jgi:hypothetical protein
MLEMVGLFFGVVFGYLSALEVDRLRTAESQNELIETVVKSLGAEISLNGNTLKNSEEFGLFGTDKKFGVIGFESCLEKIGITKEIMIDTYEIESVHIYSPLIDTVLSSTLDPSLSFAQELRIQLLELQLATMQYNNWGQDLNGELNDFILHCISILKNEQFTEYDRSNYLVTLSLKLKRFQTHNALRYAVLDALVDVARLMKKHFPKTICQETQDRMEALCSIINVLETKMMQDKI